MAATAAAGKRPTTQFAQFIPADSFIRLNPAVDILADMERLNPRFDRFRRTLCGVAIDRAGGALIEFAFAVPMFLMLMCGTVTYGGWIALAHAVQQSANEGARAALGGLTQDERAGMARARAVAVMRSFQVDPARVLVAVGDDGATLSVDVSYDASHDPRLALRMVPVPTTQIVRRSVMVLTGL